MTDATAPRQARPRGTARRPATARARQRRERRERALRYCLGPGLLRAMRGATVNVERHVPELNAMNVYPVPDGDTGINMIATMRAALAEVEAIPAGRATLSELAAAISFGALMGARGNSGVILSQVFRGMAESVAGKRRADAHDLAAALAAGTRTAYSSVARPVEGTILTVAREAAEAAARSAARGEPLDVVLVVATEAARAAVERTPDQLAVLREAGVVDAGGQGLFRALEGALASLASDRGEARPAPEAAAAAPLSIPEPTEGTWGYETVFLLHGRAPLEPEQIRRRLEEIGESVLVAGDERLVKVHVHNDRPDEVISLGLSLGALSQVTVQNLDEQTAGTHGQAYGDARGDAPSDVNTPAAHSVPVRDVAVLAVAAGEGLAEVFRSFGVERIVPAARDRKPSTGELLDALRDIAASSVIVLPNDPNVVLAAEHAARSCPEKEVVVVPTRSAPEGFAALLALDPEVSATANLGSMLAAARDVRTLLVGRADRPSRFGERQIRAGQFVVVTPDDGVVEAADDPIEALGTAIAALGSNFELLTMYLGEGATRDEAERFAERITATRPGTEVEILPGGQPHYRYLVSLE